MKRAGGRRFYRPYDIAVLAEVRRLLHQQGYTIKGVQKLHRELGAKRFLVGYHDAPATNLPEAEPAGAAEPLTVGARHRLKDALAALESAKARLDGLLGDA